MRKFVVYDSTGHILRCCDSYKEAELFRFYNQRYDWTIKISYT